MTKILSISFLVLFIISCNNEDNILNSFDSANYRKIAYESLTPESKETLTKCWCVAPVRTGKYKNENGSHIITIDDQNRWNFFITDLNTDLQSNQNLIAVTFSTTSDALLGPLTLIINPESKTVIGEVLRF